MPTESRIGKLYTAKASLYERFFVDLLGWGGELDAFFRESAFLRPNMKILDAGCGTGIITRVLYQLGRESGYVGVEFHAFDLTPKMLEIFAQWIAEHRAREIETRQADVLDMQALPLHWKEYDLIVTSALLEYLPRDRVREALMQLRERLAEDGRLLVIVTRRTPLTQWLASRWWQTHLFTDREIETHLRETGFNRIVFKPLPGRWSDSISAIEAQA